MLYFMSTCLLDSVRETRVHSSNDSETSLARQRRDEYDPTSAFHRIKRQRSEEPPSTSLRSPNSLSMWLRKHHQLPLTNNVVTPPRDTTYRTSSYHSFYADLITDIPYYRMPIYIDLTRNVLIHTYLIKKRYSGVHIFHQVYLLLNKFCSERAQLA